MRLVVVLLGFAGAQHKTLDKYSAAYRQLNPCIETIQFALPIKHFVLNPSENLTAAIETWIVVPLNTYLKQSELSSLYSLYSV